MIHAVFSPQSAFSCSSKEMPLSSEDKSLTPAAVGHTENIDEKEIMVRNGIFHF
jgi:hypothetical protein